MITSDDLCAALPAPAKVRDGLGLYELEYAMAMAIELELLQWEQVKPFVKQFRQMDADDNGRLGEADIKLAMEVSSEQRACTQHLSKRVAPSLLDEARALMRLSSPTSFSEATPPPAALEGGGGPMTPASQ